VLHHPKAWKSHRCTLQSCPGRTSCHHSCSSPPYSVLCQTYRFNTLN
jgi:hypothetical protein